MTLIIACVIIAALLPLVAKAPLGYVQSRQPGGYDNHNPRTQQASLTGLGQRALGAHNNAFESFPPFATGVLLALWAEASIGTMQALCIVYIIARILHLAFYLADLSTLRSSSWAVGFGSSLWLICLAL